MRHITKERFTKLVNKGTMLVDMRSPVAFRNGHIAGAMNMTLRQFTNYLMILSNRNLEIILYCDTFCEDDLKHALNYADQLGFTKILTADYHTIK